MFLRVTLPLAAANFLNQASRTVMAIVGPVLAVEFGLSASELGLLAACMFASYAAAQLPVGVALDTVGPRRLQSGLMLLAAAGFAAFALSSGLTGFAAARVMLGVGVSAGLMAIIKGNSQWFAPQQVAGMTGIAMAIAVLGSVVTTVPVQAVLPTLGWRGVFWLLAGLSLAAALWIALSVKDKPGAPARRSLKEELAVLGTVLGSGTFWRYAPAVAMLSVLNFTYLGLWAGPWLRDVAGYDGPARAQTLFLYTLAMLAGSLLLGQAASRLQARGYSAFLVPVVCTVALVAVQVGLMLAPQNAAAIAALWIAFAFFGSSGPSGYIALGQRFAPELTGRVSTAANTLVLGGAFLLQTAIGWIVDLFPATASGGWDARGYSWALGLSIAVHVVAAAHFAGWTLPRRRSQDLSAPR
jgi:predicted MFS family arabinose efflux permease